MKRYPFTVAARIAALLLLLPTLCSCAKTGERMGPPLIGSTYTWENIWSEDENGLLQFACLPRGMTAEDMKTYFGITYEENMALYADRQYNPPAGSVDFTIDGATLYAVPMFHRKEPETLYCVEIILSMERNGWTQEECEAYIERVQASLTALFGEKDRGLGMWSKGQVRVAFPHINYLGGFRMAKSERRSWEIDIFYKNS